MPFLGKFPVAQVCLYLELILKWKCSHFIIQRIKMNLKAQYAHIFQINYGIVCGDYFQVKKKNPLTCYICVFGNNIPWCFMNLLIFLGISFFYFTFFVLNTIKKKYKWNPWYYDSISVPKSMWLGQTLFNYFSVYYIVYSSEKYF